MFCSILINVKDNRGDFTVIKFLVGSNDRGGNVLCSIVGICVGCNSGDKAMSCGTDIGTNDVGCINRDVFENDGDCVGVAFAVKLSSHSIMSTCLHHRKIQTMQQE